jgi:hypothetical protein
VSLEATDVEVPTSEDLPKGRRETIRRPFRISGYPSKPHKETEMLEIQIPLGDIDPVFRAKARCSDGSGTLSHLFFSEDLIDIARAKAICSKCSVADACLAGAVERVEPWGVWGGQLLQNGQVVTNKRRRGRPPKTPRPELVVDEVPLPPYFNVGKTA